MELQEGGCLCGALRYCVQSSPLRVTICHCRFCQRATGSAYLVEPIFSRSVFSLLQGVPKKYSQISESSGKQLTINFCPDCGTKLFNELERLSDIIPVYAGTFDNPNWFERSPEIVRHIFFGFAQKGTIVPSGYEIYLNRAVLNDGTKVEPTISKKCLRVE